MYCIVFGQRHGLGLHGLFMGIRIGLVVRIMFLMDEFDDPMTSGHVVFESICYKPIFCMFSSVIPCSVIAC